MGAVEAHAAGTFCWVELGTTDQNAAKQFYGSLFGWTANDFPMGPDEVYTMFGLEGRNTGACYTLRPDMREHGVPPHWLLYVSVANADETAAKIAPAGGKVVAPPFDVAEFGRMAVLQDPTGATIAIWQPKMHHGTGIEGVPGTLCWADLMTPDQAAAAKFYQGVFGWQADPGKENTGYLHIKNGDKHIGGIPPAAYQNPNAPPHWLLYFLVEHCDALTAKAKANGANIYMAPMNMEGVGRWSVVADPQGAVFALFQPAR
ncbi:MAG TPA: VOC family protein [Bryobacteraceae bacterium]|nr:VOC family protein [Bryobacteraceae bacterium]